MSLFCNHLAEEETAGCFTFNCTLAVFCVSSSQFLLDLILYVPVNNFSVMSGWVFLG